MAPKKKAGGAAAEPPAKKAKVDEEAVEEKEAAPAPAPPQEKEEDDKADKRPALKTPVGFHTPETTLNVVPVQDGKVLKSLSDSGMQYLIAGARANVGVKSGRYFFEARIVEMINPAEVMGQGRPPAPKNLVRVGFSTAGSSLILGDGDKGVAFDADGGFHAGGRRAGSSSKFFRDVVVGVLLNLDASSPNANTVSLFKNGVRASQPMALPEQLKGQTLFPHVSFRNVSLQVNFGPAPLKALPFQCRTVGAAAEADVAVAKDTAPKDGKYEVVFPVAFPDEGTFHWLDSYLEKNPGYVELSDRKMQEWAVKSGVWKQKQSWKGSNDKPEYNFGLPDLDNGSIRRIMTSLAGVVPRNYVVMEVKQNLCEADRKQNLARFSAPCFKKVAHVVMGEPKADYKKTVQAQILAAKKTKAENIWKAKKAEKERKKLMAERAKAAAEARKKALEEAKAKKAAAEKKDGEEEKKEEEKKEEEKKEEEKKEEEVEPAEEKKEEDDDMGDSPPEVELTEEEKACWFKPKTTPDLSHNVLGSAFGNFSIPSKDEGFDAVSFEWQNEVKSKEYLKTWVLKRKLESRIENLQPGEAFKTGHAAFVKSLKEWQEKAKAKPAKKASDEAAAIDPLAVEDILDIGGGVPLFSGFSFEDWSLLTLRKEFHLLVTSFKADVKDDERPGIFEPHINFYYQKYFKKSITPKAYGVESIADLLNMIKDTVAVDADSKVLVSKLDEEPTSDDVFVKLSEKNRRERQRRIDAGDETARLNFALLQKMQTAPAQPAKAPVAAVAVAGKGAALAAKPANPTGPLAPGGIKPAGAGPVMPGKQVISKGVAKGGARPAVMAAGKGAVKGPIKGAFGKGKTTFAPTMRPQMSKGATKGWGGKGW